MDEAQLEQNIRLCQQGARAGFGPIVAAYADRLLGYLYRMLGNRQDAEDCLQEVFVRVVATIGNYRHQQKFEGWLFRIAGNLARDRIRRSKLVRFVPMEVAPESGPRSNESPEHAMHQQEQADALHAALSKLADDDRQILLLRHFSEMSFKDIAAELGCPLGTALARAHRALGKLRGLMKEEAS